MSKTEELRELLAPVIEELGYECVDVTFEKAGRDWILTAYVDQPGGISLDDCQKISEALSPVLDEKDPIEQSYFLEVSSPGIDRPLKKDKDYEKALNTKITISLYAKIDGKKEFTGTLKQADSKEVVLETEDGLQTFSRKDIAKAVPVIEF